MITVDDLKALKWEFVMHGDGRDKLGRFSTNLYRATLPNGEVIEGWKTAGANRQPTAGYKFRGLEFSHLAKVAYFISTATDVGDDARGIGTDD